MKRWVALSAVAFAALAVVIASRTPEVRANASQASLATINTTVDMPDEVAPEIRHVTASQILPRSAVISWTTDKPSTSQAEYGASQKRLSYFDEELVTLHTIQLADLTPKSSYSYQVFSRDKAGNIGTSSEYSFDTPPAFTISGITVTPDVASIGEEVTVSAYVTNNMDIAGSHELVLRVGNARESTTTVNLAPGERRMVSFTTKRYSPGHLAITVNGTTGSLVVRKPASAPTNRSFVGISIGVGLAVIGAGFVAGRWWRKRPI